MASEKMKVLYTSYKQERFLGISFEQFVYITHLLPSCLAAMFDDQIDHDEWTTFKQLSKILGNEFASDDLGLEEKGENLMLIYKSEIRYLIKNRDTWEGKFIAALNEYMENHQASKGFVLETLKLFVPEDSEHKEKFNQLKARLNL